PQRVATFAAAAAGAPLPRTQPRSVCQSVQGFNARSFPWANSHPGPLPLGEGELSSGGGTSSTTAEVGRMRRELVSAGSRPLLRTSLSVLAVVLMACAGCISVAAATRVAISEDANSFTLDNGIIHARVSKRTGNLSSLAFRQFEMLDVGAGSSGGYWSYDVSREGRASRVTIDPRSNDGRLGEVSIQGVFGGRQMAGPAVDIQLRYALAQGDSGLYAYCIFSHPTNYPATAIGEGRFCAKLNDGIFDWMTVDSNRNEEAITAYDWDHGTVLNFAEARRMNTGLYQGQVEHKYDYSANQFETPAWGWSSTAKHVGIWFINPATEYLSGGPTKVELCAHRDCTFTDDLNAPAPPCLLNYWRSSHYGGSVCNIGPNEAWTKVVGPFLIYCNSGESPNEMWNDALRRSAQESEAWPYDWVRGVDYPHRNERGVVEGKLIVNDPQAPNLQMSNLLVGLSSPAYTAPAVYRSRRFNWYDSFNEGESNSSSFNRAGLRRPGPQSVDWQNDAKHYEFWARGDAGGNFSIPNVRPGQYTLHAIADGILGEYVVSNVVVSAGGVLNLGSLVWQPVRYGRQLWDIGIPNRSAREFFKGDDYYHWGWYVQYPRFFPDDVTYTIGRSDFRKDWFFEQVPHDEDPSDTNAFEYGRATTWSVIFPLSRAPSGKAILRLAICGVGAREIAVSVNGQPAGTVTDLVYNATINRDGIAGSWSEHDVAFDASLMQAGTNILKLTIPGGSLTSGIMYDYVRLELAAQPKTVEALKR
ncbi:MAG TPA: polysaccharide lyase family protein, partial [Candidatus Sulfotelmatobacter sp.]|nr:polysaccharide lyase family protein [Candidatus Sulfotelmatobacter sp.]